MPNVPLLTHEEGAGGRPGAVALATRPAPSRPGGGRRPAVAKKKKKSTWQRVRTWLLAVLGVAVLGPLLAFAIGWMIFPVPTAADAAIVQTATFTFADGPPIGVVRPKDDKGTNINRSIVTLDRVPVQVRRAVLSAEDRTFYSNPGFDPLGIARAVFNNLTGGVGGGSTITQQYVKVSTGQNQNSLLRKYKEVILSIKISKDQTKDQILENYLNTVYFGRGAYGIQAAAQAYFGKDVEKLTVSEGAMLAGMIQSPSFLEPTTNEAGNQIRWNYTLDQMTEAGFITPAERAAEEFPQVDPPAPPTTGGVPGDDRFHIYTRAVQELNKLGITDEQIATEGLTVTTTVSSQLQGFAVDAITKVMKGQPADLRTALVAVDPRTGAIVAYYGGSNGVGTDYAGPDVVRQPGSTFKPFVVAAALQSNKGIGLGTEFTGTTPMVIAGQKVSNSDGDSCDRCNLITAMTRSTNTVFYQLAADPKLGVGPQAVADAAHAAGIPGDLLPNPSGGLSLGDKEVHVVDMASAYATFANDGMRRQPYIVAKVTTADGRVLLDRGTTPTPSAQAFSQQIARNVTESMLDVAAGSDFALSGGRDAAAKTGTSQSVKVKGQNNDGWTVGYTPSLSTAIWTGTDNNDPIKTRNGRAAFGRTFGGPIWQQFMNAALKGTPNEKFSDYEPLGEPAYSNAGGGGYYSGDSSTTSTATTDENGDGNGRDGDNNGDNGNGDRNGRNGRGNGNDNGDD